MVSRFRECSTLCRVVKTIHVTNIELIMQVHTQGTMQPGAGIRAQLNR